jgi:mono/diheme cytochrome c family protein
MRAAVAGRDCAACHRPGATRSSEAVNPNGRGPESAPTVRRTTPRGHDADRDRGTTWDHPMGRCAEGLI